MREQIVKFGERNNLVGVYTTTEHDKGDYPVVIILNSGVMHRVGARRISVTLARQLAANGICSLRFDFSSIGDSTAGSADVEMDKRNISETRQAMDFVAKSYAKNKFVIYGLCSGARDAFETALTSTQVVGIVQIDSHAYPNMRHAVKHYLPKIFQLGKWLNLLLKKIPAALKRGSTDVDQLDENMFVQEWDPYPPRKQIERGYQELVAHGVRFYIIYTGSWAEEYNYENQFFDMYSAVNFRDSVILNYMPLADHVLSRESDREAVIGGVIQWVKSI